jgi:hypothetical protein
MCAAPDTDRGMHMSTYRTGVKAHDDACNASEATRQVAVAAAGNNQATIKAAEITHYRAVRASCIANNNSSGVEQATTALRELGVGA